MKRKILVFLVCFFVIAAAMPASVFASTENAKKLNQLKYSGVKAYDTALPTKGAKKTEKQINALIKKLPHKVSGKGDATYSHTLSFHKSTSAAKGNYDYVSKDKLWVKYDKMTKFSFSYNVRQRFLSSSQATVYDLTIEDKNYNYYYSWVKGRKDGHLYKENKTKISGGSTSAGKKSNYKLYSDAKVLGEKCLVYSYDYKFEDFKCTEYLFISRKTGDTLKSVYVSGDGIFTTITFDRRLVSKPASFYKPPKNVTFNEY